MATILIRSLTGTVTGDTVSLSGGTASFADKNVGTAKTVTLTGASLNGTDAGNYNLASVGTTTADITPKALTASITADPKVIDGTTLATIQVTLGPGVVLGETVTVSGTRSFDTPAAGLGKTVTSSDLSPGGQTPATTPSTAPRRPRPTSRRDGWCRR